jgi:hypothetical protein
VGAFRIVSIALVVLGGCARGPIDAQLSQDDRSEAEANAGASTDPEMVLVRPDAGATCSVSSIDRDGLTARANAFAARHRIETQVAFDACSAAPYVACEAVPSSEYAGIVTFMDTVDEELARYPAEFFSGIHLDAIVFAGNLTRAGESSKATAGGAVVPYGDHRSILYLSSAQARFCNASINRRTIHHEIAHAIDFGFTGVSESDWWATMNPAGFTYGTVDLALADVLEIDHPAPGLVSRYAGASVKEDYAEVYTAMFVTTHADRFAGWLKEDRWLAAKVQAVLRGLAARWPVFVESMPNYASLP